MPKVTIYPLGNADTAVLDLADGRKILVDYANKRDPKVETDRRIDLPTALQENLDGRHEFDVVAFTHADEDHVHGAAEFFYLDHAPNYQGAGRVKIGELWVPAAFVLEAGEDLPPDAKVLQAEARHRLRKGKGIRVFSRPAKLKDWLQQRGIALTDREGLITDAGQLIPGFSRDEHGVEFFVHSPFAVRYEHELVDRNDCSLVLQATFECNGQLTRLLLTDELTHETLSDMVKVTCWHHREERLAWDIVKLPHHCSYLSLGPDRGKESTTPVPQVQWLFEQGAAHGILISTSDPVPSDDANVQPPHRQAAEYYRQRATAIDGEFVVTMGHPSLARPEPIVITIGRFGAKIEKRIASPGAVVTSRRAPRAG